MFDVVCMYSSQSEESVQLVNEVDRGKQVMVTYEQSMARKDQIINSLTRALAKHYCQHMVLLGYSEILTGNAVRACTKSQFKSSVCILEV